MEFGPIFDRVKAPLSLIRDFGAVTIYAYSSSSTELATRRQHEFEASQSQKDTTIAHIEDWMADSGLQPSVANHPSGRSLDW